MFMHCLALFLSQLDRGPEPKTPLGINPKKEKKNTDLKNLSRYLKTWLRTPEKITVIP